MKVHVFKNEDAASLAASMLVCAQILKKPESVIALENNLDLQSTYDKLVAFYRAGSLSVGSAKSRLTSEYAKGQFAQTNYDKLKQKFADAVHLEASGLYDFNLQTENLAVAALNYEQTLNKLGGIDLGLLTVSETGNVLFNQANQDVYNDCHATELEYTVPAHGTDEQAKQTVHLPVLTFGMGTLMRINTLVVLAFGRTKAASVADLVRGKITPACPASFLQLHKQLILIVDEAAASLI